MALYHMYQHHRCTSRRPINMVVVTTSYQWTPMLTRACRIVGTHVQMHVQMYPLLWHIKNLLRWSHHGIYDWRVSREQYSPESSTVQRAVSSREQLCEGRWQVWCGGQYGNVGHDHKRQPVDSQLTDSHSSQLTSELCV